MESVELVESVLLVMVAMEHEVVVVPPSVVPLVVDHVEVVHVVVVQVVRRRGRPSMMSTVMLSTE